MDGRTFFSTSNSMMMAAAPSDQVILGVIGGGGCRTEVILRNELRWVWNFQIDAGEGLAGVDYASFQPIRSRESF
jgi:hypothetical protein